ncbi:MAG: metallophosphoesterase family protein [Bacteroidetes bacterium]|nr:metallophosphoesterase family protein [Bacteroidota bacterium]
MKKILLISDTHSHLDDRLIPHIQNADEVWHAGDIGDYKVVEQIKQLKPFKAVHGNIDDAGTRKEFFENLFFIEENVKVLITHIGGYPGKYPFRIKELIKIHAPNLFICGHSHILKVMYDKHYNLLHINPGACGNHGFHLIKTAVRFELNNGKIENAAIIELGKRNIVA